MISNRIIKIGAFLLILGLLWYLFVKRDDYIIRFKVKTAPGTVMSSVEEWNYLNNKEQWFDGTIIEKNPFDFMHQTLSYEGSQFDLYWSFQSLNDSITKVNVGLSEEKHSLYNRITAPFILTSFKQKALNLVTNFKDGLDLVVREKFRVHGVSYDSIPESFYAYVSLKDVKMRDKASKMMENNAMLLGFLTEHRIDKSGYPIIQIDHWDMQHNLIDFKFGFPIYKPDSLPNHPEISFGMIRPAKALKTTYNGNYINSDRAWFKIDAYAKINNIKISPHPVEVFYDNPFSGSNELEWVAEIFLPLDE